MASPQDRRKAPRISIAGQLGGRARATLDVRLLDLSIGGARISHQEVLRPGSACTLQLPPAIGTMLFNGKIVWSKLVGAEDDGAGGRALRYESGVMFTTLTEEQRGALQAIIDRLTPSGGLGSTRLFL